MTAYTAERTWIVGETVNAPQFNTYIRDNGLNFNERITALEGAPVDHVLVHNSAAISVPNNAFTGLTFNTEDYKSVAAMHANGTNPGRLICQTAGVYEIWGCVEIAANATGYRWLGIRLNGGAGTYLVQEKQGGDGTNPAILEVSTKRNLLVNDYVELMVKQNSGGALNANATASYSPYFAMSRISAT